MQTITDSRPDPHGGQYAPRPFRRANPLNVIRVIAWRHIKESLRNRSTYVMCAFYMLLPLGLVLFTLRPVYLQVGRMAGARQASASAEAASLTAVYLLMAGVLPCTWSVGIASGAFAAEKEQGSLVPLLATPASNASIFAGKVLGSVLPALALAVAGVVAYMIELALAIGPRALAATVSPLAGLILLLLPATSLLGAGLSSMISARVRTEQIANQYGSLILTFLWLGLFVVVLRVAAWGLPIFAAAVAAVYVLACALIVLSAATWRREEVMARA
jgi:ABC-2 type transport system permease protein